MLLDVVSCCWFSACGCRVSLILFDVRLLLCVVVFVCCVVFAFCVDCLFVCRLHLLSAVSSCLFPLLCRICCLKFVVVDVFVGRFFVCCFRGLMRCVC